MPAAKKPACVSIEDAYLCLPSLKVLLFIEPDRPLVTAYRRNPQGGFEAELYDEPAAIIALPEIEADLPLAELYEGLPAAGQGRPS